MSIIVIPSLVVAIEVRWYPDQKRGVYTLCYDNNGLQGDTFLIDQEDAQNEASIPESHLEKLLDAMLAAPEYAMLAALTCPPAGATVAFAGYDAEFEAYLEGSKLRARQIRKAGTP